MLYWGYLMKAMCANALWSCFSPRAFYAVIFEKFKTSFEIEIENPATSNVCFVSYQISCKRIKGVVAKPQPSPMKLFFATNWA